MNSSSSESNATGPDDLRDRAARWIVQQDRGLSPAETVEFEAWLSADPSHQAAFNQSRATWRRYRDFGAAVHRMPAGVGVSRPRGNWALASGLAAAAVIALFVVVRSGESRRAHSADTARSAAAKPAPAAATRRLADGSVARLKADAEIVEAFAATERRIRLMRGEAIFTVTKDPARPFVVEVGGVTVRAVGTAFAVRIELHAVDILVTEGTVQVTPPPPGATSPVREAARSESAMIGAGHRAVVARASAPQAPLIVVTAVSTEEIVRTLSWSEPMLELNGATLAELVSAFAQRTGRRIEIGDPALGAVRMGGQFPTDDPEGFIRALEEIHEVKAERREDGSIVLSKAGPR